MRGRQQASESRGCFSGGRKALPPAGWRLLPGSGRVQVLGGADPGTGQESGRSERLQAPEGEQSLSPKPPPPEPGPVMGPPARGWRGRTPRRPGSGPAGRPWGPESWVLGQELYFLLGSRLCFVALPVKTAALKTSLRKLRFLFRSVLPALRSSWGGVIAPIGSPWV